jgi:hypothetical protein
MFARFTSLAIAASVLTLNVAVAAENFAAINQIQGKVLVNQGAGFVALAEGSVLNVGDQVMVGKDSAAVIAYGNGCMVSVNEAKVVTVAETAPCKAGDSLAMSGSNLVAPVADVPYAAPAAGFPLLLPLLGGAAAVGTILVLTNNGGTTVSAAAN